ncbi:MAG: DUF4388 domain-containing protein [Candidatus Obscuribacterales bacterium]|nr:DUF4388 domain-containing protein [Candidatus Obscuribacterales bacterium]
MSSAPPDISKFARSVGLLIDRCMQREVPFGTVWMVGDNKAVTCAHHVVIYSDFLQALKVRFPAINQDWEIEDVFFHPRFDQKVAFELAQRSLLEPVPAMALQDHNLVILHLRRTLSDMDAETKTTFNRKLAGTPPPRMKGLAGPVDELGLALVVQTITNARKDGCLVISDERNRPLAKMFCRDGRMVFAKFGNLLNEAAVYQMFNQHISGQFYFQAQAKPDWSVYSQIQRNTDSLLLEAHRRMDEIPNLLRDLGGEGVSYVRAAEVLDLESLSPEVQADAELIWPHIDGGISVDQLWETAGLDDYSIYKALDELYRSRQIVEMPFMGDDGLSPMQALSLAPHILLSPWDEISALMIHPNVGRAQIRAGYLVGLIRPNDPWHLLHSASLPYRAAGCPIFKNGEVIGMHCGLLPLDPKLHALPQMFSQMIWVESIYQMLSGSAKAVAALRPSKKSVGMKLPEMAASQPAANKIQCPKCNSLMIAKAKFCGTCGYRLGT